MGKGDELDPKGLIADAYRIEGIIAPECRSIFLDWALSYQGPTRLGIQGLLDRHERDAPYHPMTLTLREGLTPSARPRRRGGRSARVPD